MPKKKTAPKRAGKKPAAAGRRSAPPKSPSAGTPAPLDPIQAALARRRATLIGR